MTITNASRSPLAGGDKRVASSQASASTASSADALAAQESDHRLRNLMALITSVVQQTRVNNRNAAEYRDVLMARLQAVMKFQQGASAGLPANLEDLILGEVGAISGARLQIEPSPRVLLKPAQIRTLYLVLHELATNAMKYGALSQREGVVRIGWTVSGGEDVTRLELFWREQNGPLVRPPEQLGFGSKLIKASCSPETGGSAQFFFEPSGLRAHIRLALD